jgi:hypothetical protein
MFIEGPIGQQEIKKKMIIIGKDKIMQNFTLNFLFILCFATIFFNLILK